MVVWILYHSDLNGCPVSHGPSTRRYFDLCPVSWRPRPPGTHVSAAVTSNFGAPAALDHPGNALDRRGGRSVLGPNPKRRDSILDAPFGIVSRVPRPPLRSEWYSNPALGTGQWKKIVLARTGSLPDSAKRELDEP